MTREAIPDLGFSAVSCIFFELLSQLTRKLRRFKRALGFYGEVLAVRSDDTIGFGYGAHLPQGHPHACKGLMVLNDRKTRATVCRREAVGPP